MASMVVSQPNEGPTRSQAHWTASFFEAPDGLAFEFISAI